MSVWGDLLEGGLDVLTLGGYSMTKGAVNSATGELTNIGVELTRDISQITGKAMLVMNDVDTILVGTERLFETRLQTMRQYSTDFSQDEKDAWDATIAKIKTLYGNIAALGNKVNIVIPVSDPCLKNYLNDIYSDIPLIPASGNSFSTITVPSFMVTIGGATVTWPGFVSKPGSIDSILGPMKPLIKAYAVQILGVRVIQDKLLYYGPGPLPLTINKVQAIVEEFDKDVQPKIVAVLTGANDTVKTANKVLERVNTEDQPRIEKLLDSTNATMVDTQHVLVRFNREEQPRIEKLLDNVDKSVTEAQAVLKNADQTILETRTTMTDLDKSVKRVNGGLDLVAKYKVPILVVIGFTALVWVAISVLTMLLLIKILLGPNPL